MFTAAWIPENEKSSNNDFISDLKVANILILFMHEPPPIRGTPSLGQLKTTGLKFITSSVWAATTWTKTETTAWWKIRMSGLCLGPGAGVQEWQKPYQCDHFIVIVSAMRINQAKTLIDIFRRTQQRKKELGPL